MAKFEDYDLTRHYDGVYLVTPEYDVVKISDIPARGRSYVFNDEICALEAYCVIDPAAKTIEAWHAIRTSDPAYYYYGA